MKFTRDNYSAYGVDSKKKKKMSFANRNPQLRVRCSPPPSSLIITGYILLFLCYRPKAFIVTIGDP